MSDAPTTDEPEEPEQHKARGCFLGGLATVAALIISVLAGIILQSEVFTCEFECYSALLVATPLVLIALLVGAGLLWRRTPGFLLGIAATVVLLVVLPTACTAVLSL